MPPPQPPTPRAAAAEARLAKQVAVLPRAGVGQSQPVGQSNSCASTSTNSSVLIPFKPGETSLLNQKILTEGEYTSALSSIIKRDFFPDLDRLRAENEYLGALENGDPDKIRRSLRKLVRIEENQGLIAKTPRTNRDPSLTPSSRARPSVAGHIPTTPTDPGDTPLYGHPTASRWEDTPAVRGTDDDTPYSHYPDTAVTNGTALDPEGEDNDDGAVSSGIVPDTDLTLNTFQSRYTSEDNASFSQILDRENQRRKERYAWAYEKEKNANERKRVIMHTEQQEAKAGKRLAIQAAEDSGKRIEGKERLLIKAADAVAPPATGPQAKESSSKDPMDNLILVPESRKDDRKATLGAWRYTARNSLMFGPDANQRLATVRSTSLPHHSSNQALGFSMFNNGVAADQKPSVNYRSTNFADFDEEEARNDGKSLAPDTPTSSRIDAAIRGSLAPSVSGEDEGAGSLTPRVAGYGFVSPLPTPRAGDESEERMEQLMRWGASKVGKRLGEPEDVTASPGGFILPPSSRREELANKLMRRPAEANASPYGTAKYRPPGTPRRTRKDLTPAARQLLDRTSVAHRNTLLTPKSRSSLGAALLGGRRQDETLNMDRMRQQRWTPTPSPIVRRGHPSDR